MFSCTCTQGRPATTLFSKRIHEVGSSSSSSHQGSSGGAVVPPLLWEKGGGPFEVQSSPVHLATRSLSARSTHSTTSVNAHQSTTSLTSKRSSSSAPLTATKSERSNKRHSSRGGIKNGRSKVHILPPSTSSSSGRAPKQVTVNGRVSSHLSDPQVDKEDEQSVGEKNGGIASSHGSLGLVEENKGGPTNVNVTNSSGGGFNIAEHLQKNVDPERTDGSLSPEISQFLQDISSVVHSVSPGHRQPEGGQNVQATDEKSADLAQTHPLPRQKSKPKIAAHFGAPKEVDEPVLEESKSHSPIPDTAPLDPNVAASMIQQWYRGNKRRQMAQVQSLLARKRDELNRSRTEELQRIQQEIDVKEQKEAERQKRRAAKMQAARKAAIEDLKRKREEKREKQEKIAQEEIVSTCTCTCTCILVPLQIM